MTEPRFGSALPESLREPQRILTTDPYPTIPWAHYGPQPISFWEKVGYALIWLVVVGVLVWTEVMK